MSGELKTTKRRGRQLNTHHARRLIELAGFESHDGATLADAINACTSKFRGLRKLLSQSKDELAALREALTERNEAYASNERLARERDEARAELAKTQAAVILIGQSRAEAERQIAAVRELCESSLHENGDDLSAEVLAVLTTTAPDWPVLKRRAALDAPTPESPLRSMPSAWVASLNDAKGLCESEANKYDRAYPTTSEHWRTVAMHLGALYLSTALGSPEETPTDHHWECQACGVHVNAPVVNVCLCGGRLVYCGADVSSLFPAHGRARDEETTKHTHGKREP